MSWTDWFRVPDFDKYTIHDLREIVEADDIGRMCQQAEAWRGMAWLFDNQLGRLGVLTTELRQRWRGPAADAFLDEVGKVEQTLTVAGQTAQSNSSAWSAITAKAQATRARIVEIHNDYTTAWDQAQAEYQQATTGQASALSATFGPVAQAFVGPAPPDANAVRQPYDFIAQLVMQDATTTYRTEYQQNLQWPPDYRGPSRTPVERPDPGSDPGDRGWSGPGLSGVPAALLSAPIAAGALGLPGVPGSTPVPAGPPVAPYLFASAPPSPAGGGVTPRPSRTPSFGPLTPRLPETSPVVGPRTGISGRTPTGLVGNEPVIGGRASRPVVRGPLSDPVIGGQGRAATGSGAPSERVSAAAGRPGRPAGAAPGRDGVVRSARGEPTGDGSAIRPTGQRGRRGDEPLSEADGPLDDEAWRVEGGVPGVVTAPEPVDPRAQLPGPHLSGRTPRP